VEKVTMGEDLLIWYQDLAGVFSKEEVSELSPYHEGVDLKINLELGREPLFRPLYYHSPQELAVIREYV
jgi:hypothetical protein